MSSGDKTADRMFKAIIWLVSLALLMHFVVFVATPIEWSNGVRP